MNFARMKKSELVWMANNKCKHGHSYITHPNCYDADHGKDQRIGFLDLECSNLHANWGIILSYSIKVKGEDKIYSKVISKEELNTCLDKRVVESCIDDIDKFDRIVGYYSTRFDIPYLRTRAIILGVPFPGYGGFLHTDVYYMARNKLCLNSNRLDTVAAALFGETQKTRIEPKYWTKALMGDKKALAYILDHNQKDVLELERVYDALIDFTKRLDRSA